MDGSSTMGGIPTVSPEQPGVTTAAAEAQPAAAMAAATALPAEKKSYGRLVETIILVIVSLIAAAAIVFAVYFYLQWDEAQTNVDGKVAVAEAIAREEQSAIDEANFAEREKQPYLEFAGPSDYGGLNFMYPKTWSVYISKDASNGGDFEAFFHPVQVESVSSTTINALRVSIYNRPIDKVRGTYDSLVKNGKLTTSVFQVGSISGDRFDGAISNAITGSLVMFKVNDKTVVVQTDAALFRPDFEKLIETITLN